MKVIFEGFSPKLKKAAEEKVARVLAAEKSCACCAVGGEIVPGTVRVLINPGDYQSGLGINHVWLCAECTEVHTEPES